MQIDEGMLRNLCQDDILDMVLQVTLVKSPDDAIGVQQGSEVHSFDERGGTLGRGPSNTWTLPDPDRFLSTCHCEITSEHGIFYLVDLSTNGTFVNGSPEPLGKGMRVQLNDGDTFEIGDYQFAVSTTGQESQNNNFSSRTVFDSDPFSSSTAAPFHDPAEPFAAPPTDDLFSLSPTLENTDPLAALDRGRNPGGFESDPFFSGHGGHRDPFADTAPVDPTPSLDQALSWPDAAQQEIIPDDWEDDLMGGLGNTSPALKSFPAVSPPEIASLAPIAEQGSVIAPAETFEREPTPAPPIAQLAGDVVMPAAGAGVVAESEMPPPITPDPQVNVRTQNAQAVNDEFILALGLDPKSLSEEDRRTISEKGGKMLREVVEGLMQLLRSRSTIKNEFRMNVTTIEPFENNPFKFSVGVDEALENIFLKKGKAYKEPLEAVQESFQELGEHQLAMIAGVRVGFERMMDRFNPELLENIFKRRGKDSPIPGIKQARCWSNYCDYYAGFSDNMDSSFQSLFGTDFVQAYEDHLRKLSASRKKPVTKKPE